MALTRSKLMAEKRRTSGLALAASEGYRFKERPPPKPRTRGRGLPARGPICVGESDEVFSQGSCRTSAPNADVMPESARALVLATKKAHPDLDLPSEPSSGGEADVVNYPFEWNDGQHVVVVNLRCLTVKDPWITRIGKGLKPYELRKQKTNYRGPIILCSSVTRSKTADASKWPEDDGPKGVALYVADLTDCRKAHPRDAIGAGCEPGEDEWVWHLLNARPLKKPVPIKGALGLYKPTRRVLDAALEVLK